MNKERARAIDRFVENHEGSLQFGTFAGDGIGRNPNLVKDAGFRDLAFETALTKQKLILLKSGLSYSEVFRQSKSTQDAIAARNGKSRFIATMNAVWPTKKEGQVLAEDLIYTENESETILTEDTEATLI